MKVKLDNPDLMPKKAHRFDAGFDLYANEDGVIPARGLAMFGTGFHISLPTNMFGAVVGRSGLTARGISVPQGTIDSGYTGEVKVTIYNHTDDDFNVRVGDRIAQLIIYQIPDVWFMEVEELPETERGEKGFGSTGK